MLIHKLRIFAITLLMLGAVATGAGYLTQSLATARDEPASADEPRRNQLRSRRGLMTHSRPAPGRLLVVGRVLDPVGVPRARDRRGCHRGYVATGGRH